MWLFVNFLDSCISNIVEVLRIRWKYIIQLEATQFVGVILFILFIIVKPYYKCHLQLCFNVSPQNFLTDNFLSYCEYLIILANHINII